MCCNGSKKFFNSVFCFFICPDLLSVLGRKSKMIPQLKPCMTSMFYSHPSILLPFFSPLPRYPSPVPSTGACRERLSSNRGKRLSALPVGPFWDRTVPKAPGILTTQRNPATQIPHESAKNRTQGNWTGEREPVPALGTPIRKLAESRQFFVAQNGLVAG